MQFHVSRHWESVGGVTTVIPFAVHWGNRTIGITLFNIVLELEY